MHLSTSATVRAAQLHSNDDITGHGSCSLVLLNSEDLPGDILGELKGSLQKVAFQRQHISQQHSLSIHEGARKNVRCLPGMVPKFC